MAMSADLLSLSSDWKNEFQLDVKLRDPISSIQYSPNSTQHLLVSCWDGSVSLFHIPSNSLRSCYYHDRPVLDASFLDCGLVYSGGLDGLLVNYDLNSERKQTLGSHDQAIRCVEYCPGLRSILTGSWDQTVKMWDPRTSQNAGSFLQPDKVYALGVSGDKFIVGTRDRKICIWDLRNSAYVLQKRDSSLKYQTRCIRGFPDGERFAQSSIEGRVAVEFIDPRVEAQKRKYAFKCHRLREDGIEKIYPVNCISFRGKGHTFATGGSDGYVNMWDSMNKKRLCQFHRYPNAVTSLSFSDDGSNLAIATSYLYDEPIPDCVPPPAIFIRLVKDLDIKIHK